MKKSLKNTLKNAVYLLIALWFAPAQLTAQVSPETTATDQLSSPTTPGPCPNRKKLKFLCSMVGSRVPDNDDPKKYMYKTRIMEAACVDPAKDSEAVQHEKIRKVWATYEADLKCNNTQFDVTDGHLLKYAVTTYFDDFIYDVVKWKVNLNKVDSSDGRTVLDYITSQMQRNKGNPLEPKFEKYYKILRAAGAKHKSEL